MDAEPERRLAEDILDYLNRHPRAIDTVPGIARWWLGMEVHESNCRLVEAALQILIEQGSVERIVKGDREAIYRRAGTRGAP